MSFPHNEMRAARHRKGMSMRELGKLLDPPVGERTVHMWETGKYAPKSPRREQIIRILEMTVADADTEIGLAATQPPQVGTVNMPRSELVTSLLLVRSEIDKILSRI